jgi:hypothetical protein
MVIVVRSNAEPKLFSRVLAPSPIPIPLPKQEKKKPPLLKSRKKIPIAPTRRDLAMYGYRPAMKAEIYYYF